MFGSCLFNEASSTILTTMVVATRDIKYVRKSPTMYRRFKFLEMKKRSSSLTQTVLGSSS